MKRICVGIQVYAEPNRLSATLASLRTNTSSPIDLLLLPDGPEKPASSVLATMSDLPQSGTPEPRGAAACFNRLAATSDADVLVLLESGSMVGPSWLDYLLAALDADPNNGLAGPSTNHCWNEQCVYPQSDGASGEIARTARAAASRFGSETRTLEPLYSLADFCYVVKREVVERIGAADEEYGLGPCWEMDYNIRAARAGFRSVWACGAYVHRSPFTERRSLEETRRFGASKHRYQDKYCGARLRGEKSDYRFHCRGAACPNFAPPALITIHQAFKKGQTGSPTVPRAARRLDGQQEHDVRITDLNPLVTCIMPTYNRRAFVQQAIRCFARQDYTNTELLILDDGTDSVAEIVPESEHIRYMRLDQRLTIGAKRNLACSRAKGDFIVHWDDDDWYPPWRVRVQVRALLDHTTDVCGSSRILYYKPVTDQAWEYRYGAGGAIWLGGNTLAYRKSFWERIRFSDIQVGEDASFVWQCPASAIRDLSEPGLCVGTIHSDNASPKETEGTFWHPQPIAILHSVMGHDFYFYPTMRGSVESSGWPLVSCIMPTYNRRSFVSMAVHLFLNQDYPNRELVIVDDGDDAIVDLVKDRPGVRYFSLPGRASIGAKRNFACRQAQGEIIVHWDDDDWYSPDRLRYQVAPIQTGQADMTGIQNSFVLELPGGEFWTTTPELHRQMFVGDVHGGTLAFRKDILAHGLSYPETSLAEDAWLVHGAVQLGKRLMCLSNPGVFVYVRHGRNVWKECVPGRFIDPAGWKRVSPPPTFPLQVLDAYRAAVGASSLEG